MQTDTTDTENNFPLILYACATTWRACDDWLNKSRSNDVDTRTVLNAEIEQIHLNPFAQNVSAA